MAFLVLPAVFLAGLLLIPAGLYRDRRRRRRRGGEVVVETPRYPTVDFNKTGVRRAAGIVGLLTLANLFIIAVVSYEGVIYMETVQFCGQVCHSVMDPEFTAYRDSPHARVRCVDCHIGAGASWFVRSKLSGVGQVVAVTFDTYQRPVPTPVENLRPSRETCEECHWPQKFTGDRIRVIRKFADDEVNTPQTTVLLMHVGGGDSRSGRGIHSWHTDPRRETVYLATDRLRQSIPWVRVRDEAGRITEFRTGDVKSAASETPEGERRVMDCIDCHNRPTHIFYWPDQAVNLALAAGKIDRRIPFIKKVGVEALDSLGFSQNAGGQLRKKLQDYYRQNYPDFHQAHSKLIDEAAAELEAIYRRNVFPGMKITWGTYPEDIGHERFTGCFRCHDGEHVSADGGTIEQDCETCHKILAQDETQPEILQQLGIQSDAEP
jgi:nitrate/TMAO reductase-like tetraheme cytochrome c subunit